jgi:hypothetical protein
MVNNDRDGCRARPDEASHFVCGAEEGSTKVMEIVEDDDLPCAVCHEEKTIGLVEPHHFYVEVCFEVHCTGETGNVPIAELVHRGERVDEGFPGGVEGHGAVFYFYEIATAADGFGFDDDKRIGGIMTKGSLQGILAMRRKLPLRAGIHWRHTGIHWVLESGAVSVGDAPISIRYRKLARAGDFR